MDESCNDSKSAADMNSRLTTKEYWSHIWKGSKLPVIAKPEYDVRKILDNTIPKSTEMSFMEIGCAIGKWMAFFNKHFSYNVSGIEYVEHAAAATRRNLELQKIPADIINADFFEAKIADGSYDVVFSGGFVEHFEDLSNTINRISKLAKKYVITLVPNTYGLNGLISKKIRPKVFNSHKHIAKDLLRQLHEQAGLDTLFCDYIGGVQLIMPAAHTPFFDRNFGLSVVINLPFFAFNLVSRALNRYIGFCPRTKLLSKSLMYIGKKR